MRGWAFPVAAGLALGLVAVLVALATNDAASRTPAERAAVLASELRCPDCQGLSVADSPTRAAQEMRRQIDALVAAGASDDDVRAHFTERYGQWIRLAPSAPAAWLIPFLIVVAGVVGLIAWIGRREPPTVDDTAPPNEEERRRLHDEAEALDA